MTGRPFLRQDTRFLTCFCVQHALDLEADGNRHGVSTVPLPSTGCSTMYSTRYVQTNIFQGLFLHGTIVAWRCEICLVYNKLQVYEQQVQASVEFVRSTGGVQLCRVPSEYYSDRWFHCTPYYYVLLFYYWHRALYLHLIAFKRSTTLQCTKFQCTRSRQFPISYVGRDQSDISVLLRWLSDISAFSLMVQIESSCAQQMTHVVLFSNFSKFSNSSKFSNFSNDWLTFQQFQQFQQIGSFAEIAELSISHCWNIFRSLMKRRWRKSTLNLEVEVWGVLSLNRKRDFRKRLKVRV